jgi:hypothetical protein
MPANPRAQVARAIAFFETCDDPALLHDLLEQAAPRAKKAVGAFIRRGGEDAIPPPADVHAAREPAAEDEALSTLRNVDDFALLQALTRAIGRRLEAIEIAASADFGPGSRVLVPSTPKHGAGLATEPGTVDETGPTLRVLLDSGETWEGPASLARLAPP